MTNDPIIQFLREQISIHILHTKDDSLKTKAVKFETISIHILHTKDDFKCTLIRQ